MKFLLLTAAVVLFVGQAYALSPEMKLDMLKSRLVEELKGAEYGKALKTIGDLKATNTKLPKSFAFFEGKALYESGEKAQAYKVLEKYLVANGKEAKYYKQGISYLAKSEADYLAEIRAEEKRLEEKRKKEAAAVAENKRRLEAKQAEQNLDAALRAAAADLEKNRKQFRDSGTGLVWAEMVYHDAWYAPKDANPYIEYETSSGRQSQKYCEDLVVGGYDDWHIPTMDQYATVYKVNRRAASIVNWPERSLKVWVKGSRNFWDRLGPRYSNDLIYLVSDDFRVDKNPSDSRGASLCVRVESAEQFRKFFAQEYKVFEKDNRKLMVEDTFYLALDTSTNVRLNSTVPSTVKRHSKFDQSKSYCSNLELAGYKDWRLPTSDDFISILPCNYERKLNFPRKVSSYSSDVTGGKFWGVSDSGFFAKPVILDVDECLVKKVNNKKLSYVNVRCVRDVE